MIPEQFRAERKSNTTTILKQYANSSSQSPKLEIGSSTTLYGTNFYFFIFLYLFFYYLFLLIFLEFNSHIWELIFTYLDYYGLCLASVICKKYHVIIIIPKMKIQFLFFNFLFIRFREITYTSPLLQLRDEQLCVVALVSDEVAKKKEKKR